MNNITTSQDLENAIFALNLMLAEYMACTYPELTDTVTAKVKIETEEPSYYGSSSIHNVDSLNSYLDSIHSFSDSEEKVLTMTDSESNPIDLDQCCSRQIQMNLPITLQTVNAYTVTEWCRLLGARNKGYMMMFEGQTTVLAAMGSTGLFDALVLRDEDDRELAIVSELMRDSSNGQLSNEVRGYMLDIAYRKGELGKCLQKFAEYIDKIKASTMSIDAIDRHCGELSSAASELFITSNGQPNYGRINTLRHNYGYSVRKGDSDSFGWLTGCVTVDRDRELTFS